jgi:hypothetical protein
LGVVLLLTRSVLGLGALGWWTRWLLASALWWGAFLQRHRLLGLVQGAPWPARAGGLGEGVASGRYPVTWARRAEGDYAAGGHRWRDALPAVRAMRWVATRRGPELGEPPVGGG